jgi:hypothetical protein
VKLDPQGLSALNEMPRDLGPAGGNRHKFHLPVDSGLAGAAGPVPLGRLYLLRDTDGEPRIERLTGLAATGAVIDETYFLGLVGGLGRTAQNFRLAAGVARAVKVCMLLRPRGFEHLERVAGLVEADAGRG